MTLIGRFSFLRQAGNSIERFFNSIKHLRRVAACYDKHTSNSVAMLKLAVAKVWLRHSEPIDLVWWV